MKNFFYSRWLVVTGLLLSTIASSVWAQVSLTTINSPYSQDFNTLANTGTSSTLPIGFVFVESGTSANTTYTAGTGSLATGDTYSFGATGNTERALGGLRSGTLIPTIGASFVNSTGATITSLAVSYTGEQWRLGTAGRVDRLDFQYSLNATSLTTGTYTDVDALDFTAPVTTMPLGVLDGNATANRTAISNTITSLSIPPGATFWIRYNDFAATGSNDALGIDDFSLTPIGVAPCAQTVTNTNTGATFCTIQAAVDAPATLSGHTITVAAGTYSTGAGGTIVNINKSLTIKGANSGVAGNGTRSAESIIDGGGTKDGVAINADNVVLDGFTVQASAGTNGAGIYFGGSFAGVQIINNLIRDNVVGLLEPRPNPTVGNNLFDGNNRPGPAGGAGIYVDFDTNGMLVSGNEFKNHTENSPMVLVKGAALTAHQSLSVTENFIHDNPGGSQIFAEGISGGTFSRNNITGPTGIRLGKDNNNVSIQNNFFSTTTRGVRVFRLDASEGFSSNVTINNNSFTGTSTTAIQNETGSPQVSATCNWFGTTSNVGSFIDGAVTFSPFLTNGTDDAPAISGFQPVPNSCNGCVSGGLVTNTNTGSTYCTIQAAVDAATAGNSLSVSAGTYDELVTVNKALTIQGAGASSIVTYTGTAIPVPGSVTPTLFKVTAPNVTIQNFAMNVDLSKIRSAIHTSGTTPNLTIMGNTITPSGTPGNNYGIRNAIAINPNLTNNDYTYDNVGFTGVVVKGNTVNVSAGGIGSSFRAAVQMDLCGGTIGGSSPTDGNTFTAINHDVNIRFSNQGPVTIQNNSSLGGGIQLSEPNPGAGLITIANNTLTGATVQPSTGQLQTGALMRIQNNGSNIPVSVANNTFTNFRWGMSVENFKNITLSGNSFTPLANSTDYRIISFNTKLLASTSATITPVNIGATLTNNIFNGSGAVGGTGIAFFNHRQDGASPTIGAFTLGQAGQENTFNVGIATFLRLDNSTGSSSGFVSPFGDYTISGAPSTTMNYWTPDLNAVNNRFDVGTGLKLARNLNSAERVALDGQLFDKNDDANVGRILYYFPVHNVTQNTDFPTIQSAVDAANAGDVLSASAGTYAEAVTVPKSLTILGANTGVAGSGTRAAESIIDGSGTRTGLVVSANNVVVDGFKFIAGQGASGAAVAFNGQQTGVQILNNVFTDNVIGVVEPTANAAIRRNLFDGNNRPGAAGGSGIYTDVATNGLTIDDNEFKNHTANSAVVFGASASNTHQNLSFTKNYIHDNNASNSMVYCVAVNGGTFSGNTITQPGTTALKFAGANTTIMVSNNFLDNNGVGVRIADDGFGFGGNTGIEIHNNSLNNNSSKAIDNQEAPTINATCNWYGTTNVDAQAATLFAGAVTYSPYLNNGTDNEAGTPGFQPVPGSCVSNNPPVATANANQTATVGVAFSYTVNAFTDPESQTLTYTASIVPGNGFTFDPATRIISGTPSMSGVSSVTVTATDPGSLSASTTFTITVNPAPAIPLTLAFTASPNMLLTSGTTTLSATVSGGTTPYSYVFSGPGTINQSSGSNTATVSNIPAGVQTFTVVASDATSPTAQTISGTVSVTVTEANTAPVATANANQTATVGQAFSYTVNAFTDAETPNSLTYSASINPANGLSFNPATRIISGTPSMSGVSSVTVTATDPGSLSASTSFTITVNPVGTPPPTATFSITGVTTISCEVISAGLRRVTFNPRYAGLNGTPVSFSVVNEMAPTTNPGPYTLNLYTDNPVITLNAVQSGATNQFAYNWLAACSSSTANTPPTVANPVPPQSATVGIGYTLSLANVFTDAETPNSLVLSVTGLPAGLNFVAPSTISGTPSMSGVSTVTVTATDPGSMSASTSFTITVNPAAGTPPPPTGTFSITGVTTVSCTTLSVGERQVTFNPRYAGLNGSPVSFSVVNEMAPTTNPGPYTLNLYTDNPVITLNAVQSGVANSFAYNWLAACGGSNPPANTPPTVANPVPPQSATVGVGYTLSLANVFTDAETPNQLTLSVSGLPAGLSFMAPSTISGTPSMSGVSTVTVTATDPGSLSASTSFTITVNPAAGTPPPTATFSITGVTTVNCQVISAGQRQVTFNPRYAGLDGTPVSFSVVNEMLPTTNPGPYTLNLYTDNSMITLSALQSGVSSTFAYNWLAACTPAAPSARVGAGEPVSGLHIQVLGNPVRDVVSVLITGAVGGSLNLELTDGQGRVVSQQAIEQATSSERATFSLSHLPSGVLILRANTPTQSKTVKVIKAD